MDKILAVRIQSKVDYEYGKFRSALPFSVALPQSEKVIRAKWVRDTYYTFVRQVLDDDKWMPDPAIED